MAEPETKQAVMTEDEPKVEAKVNILVPPTYRSTANLKSPEPTFKRLAVNAHTVWGMRKADDHTVTGTFVNVECPGQPAKVCAKYYPGMDYFSKTFIDNEKTTVPLSVARWLNEECFVAEHTSILGDDGLPMKGLKKKPRYKFIVESYNQ